MMRESFVEQKILNAGIKFGFDILSNREPFDLQSFSINLVFKDD